MTRMIFILLVALLFVHIRARPQDGLAFTLSSRDEIYDPDKGTYSFSFETSNGISREEYGKILNPESDSSELFVTGSYSYITPDGDLITVKYTADKNGFHPEISSSSGSSGIPGIDPPTIKFEEIGNRFAPEGGVWQTEEKFPVKTRISSAAIATLGGGGIG